MACCCSYQCSLVPPPPTSGPMGPGSTLTGSPLKGAVLAGGGGSSGGSGGSGCGCSSSSGSGCDCGCGGCGAGQPICAASPVQFHGDEPVQDVVRRATPL